MNHQKVYVQLIENRKANPLPKDTYTEEHHIVPHAEGGSDEKHNIVKLTAREHYIAHLLLAKIYDDVKMYSAVTMMQCKSKSHERNFKFNSRLYEKIRIEYSKKISGENHWNYGKVGPNKGKPMSDETKQKLSKSLTGRKLTTTAIERRRNSKWYTNGVDETLTDKAPDGWHKGRVPKDRPTSNITKQKLSVASKERNWYNNGIINVFAKECPIGYTKGMLVSQEHHEKSVKSHIGQKAWNKGIPCSEAAKEKLRQANTGKHLSSQTRNKISKALSGKQKSQQMVEKLKAHHALKDPNRRQNIISIIKQKKNRRVVQLTLDNIYVKEFPSINDAIIETKVLNISPVCRGARKDAGGFHWMYYDDWLAYMSAQA